LQKLNTVKGTKDHFGHVALSHDRIISKFKRWCEFLNYQKISTPILEHSKVFTKTLGVTSDIISKEMYNFTDQGGDNLVLRPEGTASVVRALISNSLQDQLNKSFYYFGPMFRRERPQSGRLRQFHQVGVEIFGIRNYMDDVRTIILAEKFLESLKIRKKLNLQINTLGTPKCREKYENDLVKFLKSNFSYLSDESKKKTTENPLRVLDSKDKNDKKVIESSPKILDYLDDESALFFEKIINALNKLKINFELNPFLVRGLDYYNHTTFEYIFSQEKSQNAILAGGRYDGLVKSLGGNDLAGVGWAAGIERMLMLHETIDNHKKIISFFSTSSNLEPKILEIYNQINFFENISINIINDGSLKKKMAKANKVNSFGCIVIGDDELINKEVVWKNFKDGSQQNVSIKELNDFLKKYNYV
tara:strand:- start:5098 stop:6351 length:1254 start_codon:yes stop_codon:yes gene_type:complete